MGTTYYVHALGDPWVETLRSSGQILPLGEPSRRPTASEVAALLASSSDLGLEEHCEGTQWSATIQYAGPLARSTRLVVDEAKRGRSQGMRFEGGDPELMIAVLERLARTCGVLVLRAETSLRPIVIRAGIDPIAALAVWRQPLSEGLR